MAWSAPTILGSTADKVSAASKTISSLTANLNDLVICAGFIFSGGNALTGMTISDSAANTWTTYVTNTTGKVDFLSYCVIASGKTWGGSSTITITRTGTTNITSHAVGCVSFTGGLTSSVEDSGVRASAAGSSFAPTVTSGAASVAGDLFIAVSGDEYNTSNGYAEATGWTSAQSIASTPAAASSTVIAYQVNAGTSAKTHNPTLSGGVSGSHAWTERVTAFFVSGAAPSDTDEVFRSRLVNPIELYGQTIVQTING